MAKSLIFVSRLPNRTRFHAELSASLDDPKVDYLLTEGAATCHLARYQTLTRCLVWGYDYIGWVDDDDLVVSGIHRKLESLLEADPMAAVAYALDQRFTDTPSHVEPRRGKTRRVYGIGRSHHPLLFRSSILKEYYSILKAPRGLSPERQLITTMVRDGHYLVELDEVSYHWRQWEGQDHRGPNQAHKGVHHERTNYPD